MKRARIGSTADEGDLQIISRAEATLEDEHTNTRTDAVRPTKENDFESSQGPASRGCGFRRDAQAVRFQAPRAEARSRGRVEGQGGKDTATKPTSSAQETTKETKDENPLERLTSLAGGLKIDTSSGIPKKNIDAYTEWRAVYKSLKDFGLESVSAEEASSLVAANKAVILDVRTDLFFDKQHAAQRERSLL